MILEQFPEVRKLSSQEKLRFMDELWLEIAQHPETLPVDPVILDELDRRMADFHADPTQCTTWEDVRDRLLNGKHAW